MKVKIYLIVFLLQSALSAIGQDDTEIFLSAGVNLYLPRAGSAKSVYPILGYNKNTSPKILLGGVSTGISIWKPLGKDLNLKTYVHISKQTYWDEPIEIRNAVGTYFGPYQSGSSDYIFGLGGTLHYTLVDHLSIGTGVGFQALLFSLARIPEIDIANGEHGKTAIVTNRYYKRVLPMLPLELSYKLKRLTFGVRYDIGLLNRLKGDLGKSKKDKFDLITFETAFKLR